MIIDPLLHCRGTQSLDVSHSHTIEAAGIKNVRVYKTRMEKYLSRFMARIPN